MATISTAHTLLKTLKDDLAKIQVVRDYQTNLGEEVYYGVYRWAEVTNRPAVAFWPDEITLIPEDRTIGTSTSQSNESLSVTIVGYADVDDDYDMLHKIIKDIRKFLLSDDNTYKCDLEEENISITPYAGKDAAWVLFEIEFQYYITSTNP